MITFDCNLIPETNNYQCEIPYIETIETGGETIYIDSLWNGGDVLISFFLFVFLILIIARWIFDFFLPQIIKIKRK